jgi:hypothetical protein
VPDYITEQCFPEPVATSDFIERSQFALSATMSNRLEERGKGARALALKEVRTSADVEKDSVRRIECDERREAVAPVGDRFQKLAVRPLVSLDDAQRLHPRAGICERKPGIKAETCRLPVNGEHAQRVFAFRSENEWQVIWLG